MHPLEGPGPWPAGPEGPTGPTDPTWGKWSLAHDQGYGPVTIIWNHHHHRHFEFGLPPEGGEPTVSTPKPQLCFGPPESGLFAWDWPTKRSVRPRVPPLGGGGVVPPVAKNLETVGLRTRPTTLT